MTSSQEKPPPNALSPRLISLQQPEKLSKVLEEDKDDCLACRLTGAAAFIGLGGYIYYSGKTQIAARSKEIARKSGSLGSVRARMMGSGLLSLSFVGMGLYRLVN
ncbi:hypothetical protein N7G274_002252 [Stereocaulon virgatum]|uniref:Distal membrane-arm assembly complex protein 1-like domain-containing protein n=1 Tax=Stereocaulon virgatum TaxID=373712 RepID=A0ABR4AK07_9LECA